jgi:hypothetical protein
MIHAHGSDCARTLVNWTLPSRVWVTEDESRWFRVLERYTVHAIVDGQEQTMSFLGRTVAARVAEQAGKTTIYPKFSLRSVYNSIYCE